PHKRWVWTDPDPFHRRCGARRANHVEPRFDCVAAVGLLANPRNRKVLAAAFLLIRRAAEDSLFVFKDLHNDRLIAFAANHLLAKLEIEPTIVAPVLPACRSAWPAIFNEEVARVGVHVGHTPGKMIRATHGHDRATGKRGTNRILAGTAR